jgi:hypothetical protein
MYAPTLWIARTPELVVVHPKIGDQHEAHLAVDKVGLRGLGNPSPDLGVLLLSAVEVTGGAR